MRNTSFKYILLASLIVGAAALILTLMSRSLQEADEADDQAAPRLSAPSPTPDVLAQGRAVYEQYCAACHGVELEGETPDWRTRREDGTLPAPPHDETGHTWHHSDFQLFLMTRHGMAAVAPEGYVSNMPAFEDVLDDDEIWAAIAYIKSTWSSDVRVIQEEITRRELEVLRERGQRSGAR